MMGTRRDIDGHGAKRKGRPTVRTKKLEDEICDRLADGESMRQICRDAHMPNRITVLRWLDADEDLATRCARAREMQADTLDDDMADIERQTLDGTLDPKAANVVLSSKRWRAAKMAPKKYGDKTAMELTGANGGPVQLSDADRAARLAGLLALAQKRKDDDGPSTV